MQEFGDFHPNVLINSPLFLCIFGTINHARYKINSLSIPPLHGLTPAGISLLGLYINLINFRPAACM